MKLLQATDQPPLGPLRNRVVMAPMTRGFAPDHLATPQMADYYARRAEQGVGLIVTEGTVIHQSGDGYRDVPHMDGDAQSASWKPLVARVQESGTKIISQLWHCGRISHPDFTGGVPPLSSTDRAAEGHNRQNDKPFGTPRALEVGEMPEIYGQYVHAAEQALAAGFDAVELHFANGYLADQFLDGNINDRTDAYGGSVANRCRFVLECLEEVLAAVGPEKVALRLSPIRDMGGIYEWPDLDEMIAYLIPAMDELGLRMLSITNARADYHQTGGRVVRQVRPLWPHFMMAGASLSLADAERELTEGWIDAVTWGRALIANSDLVTRLESGTPLREFEMSMLGKLE
ncbi:alkene reductase [Magnetospira thiophila]